ncbi:MAG: leucine-rich repeat protein [Phycisphaerae bacterium]|nr:leucine-rich repeat protein [Phycisphaerae bacterium]
MNRLMLIIIIVFVAIFADTQAYGYSFGQWASQSGLPLDAKDADASGQGISNLEGLNVYTELEVLYLYDNQLISIDAGSFAGLNKLRVLFLQGNQIAGIGANSFAEMRDLEVLMLGDNELTSIGANTFAGLGKLNTLIIDDNDIQVIQPGAFVGLINLENLMLSRNNISSIASGSFAGLGNLAYLYLGQNQISKVNAGVFDELHKLKHLSLVYSDIGEVAEGIFSGFPNLESLALSHNHIQNLNLKNAELNHLKDFNAINSYITKVDLSYSKLSGDTLTVLVAGNWYGGHNDGLVANPDLDEFDLSNADLSELNSISELARMVTIKTLNISNVTWSQSVIASGYQPLAQVLNALEQGRLAQLTIDIKLYDFGKDYFDTWDALEGNTLLITCDYQLTGDLNDDCVCDLQDFVLMANSWLIDCNNTSENIQLCLPK